MDGVQAGRSNIKTRQFPLAEHPSLKIAAASGIRAMLRRPCNRDVISRGGWRRRSIVSAACRSTVRERAHAYYAEIAGVITLISNSEKLGHADAGRSATGTESIDPRRSRRGKRPSDLHAGCPSRDSSSRRLIGNRQSSRSRSLSLGLPLPVIRDANPPSPPE
jgi:hypothetical protein